MGLFAKLFGKEDTDSYAARLKTAKSLHGLAIKYVTEMREGNEDVVGRGGYLTLKDDEFIVDSSGERLFCCKVSELEASKLMSGDGVIIRGPNLLEDGKFRAITVHFVYYRK